MTTGPLDMIAIQMVADFPIVFSIFWAWIGACVGSFLNVCIWRIPNGMSIVSPPSHCPKCDHAIPFYENIPVFSWLFLRGKCSSCKEPISIRYPLVETLTGLVFLAIFLLWQSGNLPGCGTGWGLLILLQYMITAAILIASAFTDCDYRIIPDSFVVTLLISVLLTGFTAGRMSSDIPAVMLVLDLLLPGIAAGVLLTGVALLGKAFFQRTAFGWGDVKLLAVLAVFTHIDLLLWILLAASVLTVLCAPILRKLKPKMRHRGMPFAPFIAIATALIMLTPLGSLLRDLLLKR